MLSKVLPILFLLLTFSSCAEISEEGKYASFMVQVNFDKYGDKIDLCREKRRNFKLTDGQLKQMKAIPKEANAGIPKLLDDAMDQCGQPELFNLTKSLLLLEKYNETDKSKVFQEQIDTIKMLIVSPVSISNEMNYEKLSPEHKEALGKVEFLKYPFDPFVLLEEVWGAP